MQPLTAPPGHPVAASPSGGVAGRMPGVGMPRGFYAVRDGAPCRVSVPIRHPRMRAGAVAGIISAKASLLGKPEQLFVGRREVTTLASTIASDEFCNIGQMLAQATQHGLPFAGGERAVRLANFHMRYTEFLFAPRAAHIARQVADLSAGVVDIEAAVIAPA